jgi:large subunit ribosomal protein L24
MKNKFNTSWKASKQPRKQRKFRANAPLHLRKKFVSVNLSKELRAKEEKRNINVKKGDVVKILRGKFKDKKGKILEVNLKTSRIVVEGIQNSKMDGSKANIRLQPSNLQIIEMTERGKKTKTSEKKTIEDKTEKPKSKVKPEIKESTLKGINKK